MKLFSKNTGLWLFVELLLIFLSVHIVSAQTSSGAKNNFNFAKDADLATITIDQDRLTKTFADFTSTKGTSYSDGSYLKTVFNDGEVSVKMFKPNGSGTETVSPVQMNKKYNTKDAEGINPIDPGNFTITFRGAAILNDGSRKDLVLSFEQNSIYARNDAKIYSDSPVVLSLEEYFTVNGKSRKRLDFKARTRASIVSGKNFGYRSDNVTFTINGGGGSDTFLFTLLGVNINRENPGNGAANFSKIKDAGENNNFSERVQLLDGAGTVYIPDIHYPQKDSGNTDFLANKYDNRGALEYSSGFATLVHTSGISAKMWQSAPASSSSTDFYLLPDEITYTITSSSGDHGSIATGRSGRGTDLPGGTYNSASGYNPDLLWTWDQSKPVPGPKMYDVPYGKPVTYTMTPEQGYIIDKLFVGTSKVSPTKTEYNADGSVAYYTYVFPETVRSNQSIHVTWKEAVSITVVKVWSGVPESQIPEKIQVELKQDGKSFSLTDSMKRTFYNLDRNNGWSHTFRGLPAGHVYMAEEADSALDKTKFDVTTAASEDGKTITITNKLKFVKGELPKVMKFVKGKANQNDIYKFKLTAIDGAPMPEAAEGSSTMEIEIPFSGVNNPVSFGDGIIEFPSTDGKTYKYTVGEVDPGSGAAYDYDPDVYNLEFTVMNGAAERKITVNGQPHVENQMWFYNIYPSDGWVAPRVVKEIDIAADQDETFTFELRRGDEQPIAPMPGGDSSAKKINITVKTGDKGAWDTFGDVEFKCPQAECKYHYYIREIKPDSDPYGVVYDQKTYHTVITIKDGEIVSREVFVKENENAPETGPLSDDVDDQYEFTNKRLVMPSVTPVIKKVVLDDEPDRADRFYFQLERIENSLGDLELSPMPKTEPWMGNENVRRIYIDGDAVIRGNGTGEGSFFPVQFKSVGTYTYKISEIIDPKMEQYIFDPNEFFLVTLKVEEVNGEIKLSAIQENSKGDKTTKTDSTFTFTNEKRDPKALSDNLLIWKHVTPVTTDKIEPFQFQLTVTEYPKDMEKIPMPAEHGTPGIVNCVNKDSSNKTLVCTLEGERYYFHMGLINFPVSGHYEYEVRELPGDSTAYEYDTKTVYRILYDVNEDASDYTWKIEKNGMDYSKQYYDEEGKETGLVFTNKHLKRSEADMAHVNVPVRKYVKGGDAAPEDIFRFTLSDKGNNVAGLDNNPMPKGVSARSVTIEIKGSDDPMAADFGTISFDQVGEYDYELREVRDELEKYRYDPTVYQISWIVTSDGSDETAPLKAELYVEMDGYQKIFSSGQPFVFENVVLAENEAVLEVEKFVSGGSPAITDPFSFALTPVSNTVEGLDKNPLSEKCEADRCLLTVFGTNKDFFPKIAFEKDGDYVYEVREIAGTSEDYVYDTSVYTVTYTVIDGKVRRPAEIRKGELVLADHNYKVTFVNNYTKGVDEMHPTIRKVIKGDPNRDDVFTFELKSAGNNVNKRCNPMPRGADLNSCTLRIERNGRGRVTFGTLAFDTPGIYYYEIREIAGDGGYQYDPTVYTVTYSVTSGGEGVTNVIRTIRKGGVDYEGEFYEFTNVWGSGSDDGGDGDSGGSSDVLPKTGFAPGIVTKLPQQRVAYSVYSQVRVKIPALGVNAEILGVPKSEGDWDVSWLGDNVGWLQNTAWPASSKAGNAVLTGHSYNYLGEPGVFANLDRLGYGAMITVSAYGEDYTYMVENVQTVFADTPRVMSQKTDVPELTLITCKYYNAATDQYDGRVVVKAKLVEIR